MTSQDGDKCYEIECEIEMDATVTYIVYAESPEAAVAQLEASRSWTELLEERDHPEIERAYITDIGTPEERRELEDA